MDLEVRLYSGTAAALEGNKKAYPTGERHAFILFLSQSVGAEPDWMKAKEEISLKLWSDVDLKRTGIVSKEKQRNHPFSEMYPHALECGSALLIYSRVEGDEP